MRVLRIVDFDGTLTDPIIEGRIFTATSILKLAEATGMSGSHVGKIAHNVQRDMRNHPDRYDWHFNGYAVSSLVGDPYLRIIAIANTVARAAKGLKTGDELARQCLDTCYPTVSTFRSGAGALITDPNVTTHIVTNGTRQRVESRLRMLLGRHGRHTQLAILNGLHASAERHVIDPKFAELSEYVPLPGRARPLLLRRAHYFRILNKLREQAGVEWEEVEVIGDNLDLDLAVPFAMGAHIVLVVNRHTPTWETAFVERYQRGRVVTTLEEISNTFQR